jgi:DNA-binding CsgD family transcriptional regulator
MTPNIAPVIWGYSWDMSMMLGGLQGLFEREAEVAAIEAAVGRALTGAGGLLVVRGPAGIGKSALLRVAERLADEQGAIVLRGRAAPFEREFPYGVVRQLFEPIPARDDLQGEELFAGAASGAQAVLGDEPRVSVAPDSLFVGLHALYWLTVNLASHAPVLICVDDVIWCDEASLRYLEFLVRRLEGMAAVVALAYRTGEPGASDVVDALVSDPLARVVQPRPLSEAALARMLGSELGEEVDPQFCAACETATGGNPLLVSELLRSLETEHVRPRASEVPRVRGIGAVAVGPAVRRRLGSLGERAEAVARAVAVLGEGVRRDDLASAAEVGAVELEEVLEALASAAIIRSEDERISFVHPLVADAARASLTPRERARLHQRAIRALSDRGASAWELAPHVVACDVRAHPGAVGLLLEAARWALAAGAPEAAVTYLSRATAELDPGEDPAPLMLELGKAKVQAGDSSARTDLGRAIELSRDVRTRARARIALSVVLFAANEHARSIDILDRGLDEVAAEDPELAERMEGQLLSNIQVVGPGQVNLPRSIGERVNRARSDGKPRDSVAGRLVLCSLAYEELMGGGAACDVVMLAEKALANDELLLSEGPACLPLYRAAVALLGCDELERGAAICTRAMAEARRLGSPTAFAWASAWRCIANTRLGRLVDGEADANAALESGDQYLSGYGLTLARIWLAVCLTEQGRLEDARAELSLVAEPDPPSMIIYALTDSRARFHLACGDYEAAASDVRLLLRLEEPLADFVGWRRPAAGVFINQRVLGARALIGLGDLEGARALVEEEMPRAEAFGTHRGVGMTLHAAGMLEHGDTRIQTLNRATEELAHSQSRLEYALALCDYGAALRRANRRSEARVPLQAALAVAREAQARPLRDRAAEELKATGARVSRPALSGVDALTASEHRIASMAARGMSNRDIAQGLFVTVKTVEMHLGRAYHKLNLRGRSQLAAALGDRAIPAEG